MQSQSEKGERFRSLHQSGRLFVMPNPWDAGTARILQHLGFEALATTSAGCAFSLGRRDGTGEVSLDDLLANARQICSATDLPVSADLEDGFARRPADLAVTIERAAEAGLVGCSIEDASDGQIRDVADAAERVAAAVAATSTLPTPFLITARAENFLHGRPDIDDTVRRLQAYEEAGADVLYAPGLTTIEQVQAITSSLRSPVNVVVGGWNAQMTVAELEATGVARISVGGGLARAALTALVGAAREILERGSFSYAASALSEGELVGLFGVNGARGRTG